MPYQIGVIGGSGFIGAALVEVLLACGHRVRIIDREPSRVHPESWVAADVRERAALEAACAGCEVLYNLAAEHRDDVRPRSRYREVNVGGAEATCAVATALGIRRVIFTSTVAVYGLTTAEADESAPPRPFNDYGRTKLEAEEVFRTWAEADPGRHLTIVRPTVVFGPDNRGNVFTLLEQLARGCNIVIGAGRNRKSIAYVGNVAAFLAFVLDLGPGVHLYNYVDKPDLDMNQLVALTGDALGRGPITPHHVPFPLALLVGWSCDLAARLTRRRFPISAVRVRKYRASTQFAATRVAESGFVPSHDLQQSLIDTIRHEFGNEISPSRDLSPRVDPAT